MATKDEKNEFSLKIEKIVSTLQISYIDAITHYCEQTGLEVEIAATLLNETIKSKIQCEAQQLRFLPRSATLPI